MHPTTSNFQKWSSCSSFNASLSDTPFLVHYPQPPSSSLSMSPLVTTYHLPPPTSSNVEAVSIQQLNLLEVGFALPLSTF